MEVLKVAKASNPRKIKYTGSWKFESIGKFYMCGEATCNGKVTIKIDWVDPDDPYINPNLPEGHGTGQLDNPDNIKWQTPKEPVVAFD